MKNKLLSLFAIFAIGLLATAGAVSAFGGFKGGLDDETRDALDVAIENNDFDSWKNLRESLLTENRFEEVKERHQERSEMRESRDLMREAIESDDYDAYTQAVLEIHPEATVMSEDDFAILVDMHVARDSGDMDTWQELRDEYDIRPMPMGRNMNGIGAMNKGFGHESGQGFAGFHAE